MSWTPEYRDGVPVRVRWTPDRGRAKRRCPRTWPHEKHGPWHTGEIVDAQSAEATTFDCPGVPYEKDASA